MAKHLKGSHLMTTYYLFKRVVVGEPHLFFTPGSGSPSATDVLLDVLLVVITFSIP